MKVVPFRRRHCAESVAVLRHLLERAERGEILGLAICAKSDRGEEVTFAGNYRRHPEAALSAAMRMSWRLTQKQDEA